MLALGCGLRLRDACRRRDHREPRRLLANKLSAIGDTILLVPALRALRRRYPAARITFVCSSINREVVECFPAVGGQRLVDEVVFLELGAHARRPLRFLAFLRDLRRRRFDLTVDFDQWIRTTSLVTAAIGAPTRVGFRTARQHRHLVYNRSAAPARDRHEVLNFLALAARAGARDEPPSLELSLPPAAIGWARERLPRHHDRRCVALHPGCGRIGGPREWPAERYMELGRRLAAQHPVTIVITGGPGEAALVERVRSGIGAGATAVAEVQSFGRFAALLERCNLLVCGNTGAMHAAAAVGTPVVGLHGPSNPKKWGPWGAGHTVIQSALWCSPCLELGFEYGCKTYPCMPGITVDEVYEAVVEALARRR